jgi:hypothetical protein
VNIVRRDLYDHENGTVTLYSERDLSKKEIEKLSEFLDWWVKRQIEATNHSRPSILVMVREGSDNKAAQLTFEKWFPEEWFEPLARALEWEFPSLWLFAIGHDFKAPFRDDTAFIRVPQKIVELEDGKKTQVQPFEIAKYPISIAQFSRFCQETGYRTVAEQRNHDESFRDNQFISGIPPEKRSALAVMCISFIDATSYCEWSEVRLPTEAEWLAAAVIDERICDNEDVWRLRSELRENPAALVKNSEEITGTTIDARRVVLRTGPYLIRCRTELTIHNRRVVSVSNFEDPVEFRVCTQLGIPS